MKEQDSLLSKRRLLHTTVFAQCFSPCGKYLVAASNFGHIAVYSLVAALAPNADEDTRRPIYSFKACNEGAIYSLVSTESLLISAGNGDICAWKWSEILDKTAKIVWTLKVPQMQVFTNPEINSIALDKQESSTELYAGCGDNNVYVWDIETGEQTRTFSGHRDYVHCVCIKNSSRECVSAAEDGTVRIWDCRVGGEAVHILEPNKHELTARSDLGKWVGCVACDNNEDWLVCGGAPHLSSWHLRSLAPVSVFNTPGATHNFVNFYDDTVISGGSEACVNHWFVNGDVKSKVPCSASTVFDVSINSNSSTNKVLCVSGSSPKIDVCTNFGYKAFSLLFEV
ncbi:THO complex subunit 6 homolog isoform X2 [Mercenaria mercenaria]|uniref:THO complex subunit 6 homolog isoform X2 n=1 Tax=Mercenaria mercenaria TaxID=6596 RepID=UPI001E1E0FDC|nr:THO complex subunit 6 homolog isoform X2 [Mercenaria mercenaria]